MPTTVSDQFFTFDPANPPPSGTDVTPQQLTLIDQNDDGDIDRFNNDTVDGLDVTSSYGGDTVTIETAAGDTITYTGTTFYLSGGNAVFTPTDGQFLKPGEFVSSTFVTSQSPLLLNELGPPCYVAGTRLATPSGLRRIEDLRAGDILQTVDRGPQPILAVRHRSVGPETLAAHPRHAPIRLPAAAFGGLGHDLLVSPQHRMMLRSRVAKRMFGQSEVLAPAAQLVGHAGIARETPQARIDYIHVLFDHHALVVAEGLISESLLLARNSVLKLERTALLNLRKTLSPRAVMEMRPARFIVSGHRLATLLRRHAKNSIPLVEPCGEIQITEAS